MPPAEKVSASSRDQKTVRGIQHKTSAPKRLREALRQKQNQLKKMEEQWDKGKYVSWYAWTALKYGGLCVIAGRSIMGCRRSVH